MKNFLSKLPIIMAAFLCLLLIPVQVKADGQIAPNTWTTFTNDTDYSTDDYKVKYTATETGYFTVTQVLVSSYNREYSRTLHVYDDNNQEMGTVWNSNEKTPKFSCTKGLTYTIKFSIDDKAYTKIYVEQVGDPNWEKEHNNDATTANTLKNNVWMYGNNNYQDTDWFKIKIKKASKVTITFGPKDTGVNTAPYLYMYNTDNSQYCVSGYTKSVTNTTVYLNKGTYYFRVTDSSQYPYKLLVKVKNYKPKKVAIRKIKTGSKWYSSYYRKYYNDIEEIRLKNTTSITGSNNTAGYAIQIAKKSSMRGRLDLGDSYREHDYGTSQWYDTKTVIRRMDNYSIKRGTYYVRVRNYVKTPYGIKLYGPWSSPKKVKL